MQMVEYLPPDGARNAVAVFVTSDGERWTVELVGHRPGRPATGPVRVASWLLRPAPAGRPGRPRAAAHVREQGPAIPVPSPADPAAVAAFWFQVLRACRQHDGVVEALAEMAL